MAPKRKAIAKGKEKEKEEEYNANKFVSLVASRRFEGFVKKEIQPLPERGFNLGDEGYNGISDIIDFFGWKKFCAEPDAAAIVPLVREFYANAVEHHKGKVMVRKTAVSIMKSDINKFYGLKDIPNSVYATYLDNVDYNEVIGTLCKPCALWKMSDDGQHHMSLEARDLNKVHRVWNYFVSAKLMPSSHTSSVTRDRAILLFCITTRRNIDVGSVMFASIMHSVRSSSVSFYFPHLITALCYKSGVPYNALEELMQPKMIMDRNYINKIKDWTSYETVGSNVAPSSSSRKMTITERMDSLENEIQGMRTYMETEVRDFKDYRHQHSDWFSEQMSYQAAYLQSIHQMQRLQLSNSGVDMSQFPEMPVYLGSSFTYAPVQYEARNDENEVQGDNENDENMEE